VCSNVGPVILTGLTKTYRITPARYKGNEARIFAVFGVNPSKRPAAWAGLAIEQGGGPQP